jgi:hypothetical protein
MSEYEKLEELGIDEETYRALSVERQIEIFVEMEEYFPHNSTVRMWMQTAIRDKGPEAVGPLVGTVRGLADQRDISFLDKMAIADLAYVLGWIHLSKQADLKGTPGQTVLEEVAASNIEEPLKWEIRSALYMILCDKDPPIYPKEPDLTCGE